MAGTSRTLRRGVTLAAIAVAFGLCAAGSGTDPMRASREQKPLPAPAETGTMSLEQALRARRSVREFEPTGLTERQIAQLLWAAQGVIHAGHRTAPSAGALFPLELYVATYAGFGHYEPATHRLTMLKERDLRSELQRAAFDQVQVGEAPAVFVIAAVFERTERKYGPARSARYVPMEAGHAAQNLLLEAVALGLGGVPMGAFDDARVARVLDLPAGQQPLVLIPVGHPR